MGIRSIRATAGAALVAAAWGGAVWARDFPALAPPARETQPSATVACVQPPPMVSWEDYHGPFQKFVGAFGRRLERKSAHAPHYKQGAVLCVLSLHDKFLLSVRETFDPVTVLGVAYDAGISQAENNDPSYGQGAEGYWSRFGAGLAGEASSQFFKDVLYPTIFSQDPRYYRLGHGSTRNRFLHALQHSVVAHREDGTQVVKLTHGMGTTSAAVLRHAHRPDKKRGVGPAPMGVANNVR